ncbi:MAG: hypothetical protein QM405_09245 [Euryarchaeota archaeon]|jgi:hypothetical protein|nr:hypothetical protein [Euryarchaeota archaeon]
MVDYTLTQIDTMKDGIKRKERIPKNVEMKLLEGDAAEAYLAGYYAASVKDGTIKPETTEPVPDSTNLLTTATKVDPNIAVQPLRFTVPWWP